MRFVIMAFAGVKLATMQGLDLAGIILNLSTKTKLDGIAAKKRVTILMLVVKLITIVVKLI